MQLLNYNVMAGDTPTKVQFVIQQYDYESWNKDGSTPSLLSPTDDSQADSVRSILQRFAVTGVAIGRDPSRDSYIGDLREDEPIDTEKVNDMLDTPDLSMLDEMEIKDYIRDNISFTEKPKDQPDGASAASPSGEQPPVAPE